MRCTWRRTYVLLARLSDRSDHALTADAALIREVILRGRRDLLERHHLLRELSNVRHQLRSDVVRDQISQVKLSDLAPHLTDM